jgi:hypothetical protein
VTTEAEIRAIRLASSQGMPVATKNWRSQGTHSSDPSDTLSFSQALTKTMYFSENTFLLF